MTFAVAIACMFALSACSGGSTKQPTVSATTSPASDATIEPTQAAAATGTPNALASTAADAQHVFDDIRKLAVDIGPRVAGTPAEMQAANYLRDELASYGYDVSIQDFAFDASAFRPSRVDSGGNSIGGYAFRGSGEGTVTGPLVLAGIGKPEEFPAGGAHGDIAVIERGELTFTEKTQNAIAAGASAVIIYNNAAGSVTGQVDPVSIPVVGIAADAGSALAAGTTATVTVPPAALTGHNVVAKPKGTADCTSVTGGHYDSVPATGGADDNASGAASVVEVARVAAANHLAGANCFVLFSGEEFGLFGSKAFISTLSPDQVNKLREMINLDVVGISGALGLIGDADLVDTARLQAERLDVTAEPSQLPQGAGSDHLSFRNAGIPVLMLSIEDNLIHTQRDAIDRIDIKTLDATVRLAYATLAGLSTT
jgi:Zn-dependent M28 family amino/carboxypeptidase